MTVCLFLSEHPCGLVNGVHPLESFNCVGIFLSAWFYSFGDNGVSSAVIELQSSLIFVVVVAFLTWLLLCHIVIQLFILVIVISGVLWFCGYSCQLCGYYRLDVDKNIEFCMCVFINQSYGRFLQFCKLIVQPKKLISQLSLQRVEK